MQDYKFLAKTQPKASIKTAIFEYTGCLVMGSVFGVIFAICLTGF